MTEKVNKISSSADLKSIFGSTPILDFFQFRKGTGEVYQVCENCWVLAKHRYDNSKCWCTKCGGYYALDSRNTM